MHEVIGFGGSITSSLGIKVKFPFTIIFEMFVGGLHKGKTQEWFL